MLYAKCLFAENEFYFFSKKEQSRLSITKYLSHSVGREWYVDIKSGDDQNGDGTSLKSPFKTIGKAIGKAQAGDAIIISSGVYRERLYINKRGTEDKPIIFGPRGDGEVIIDASEKIAGWTEFKKGIYKANCGFSPIAVIVDDKALLPGLSINALNEEKWYYDTDAKTIYLYLKNGDNPQHHDIGIISPDKYQEGINIHGANHIVLYGLTVRFSGGCGISILGSNNRIEKCNVKYNGNIGIRIFSYNEIHSSNNEIINNHVYHNFLRNWPRGRYKDGGWGSGICVNASSDNKLIGNIVHKNGGEGLLAYGSSKATLIRDNVSYDNWSVNIYIDGQSDCTIENNLIFCNKPEPGDLYNNNDNNPSDGKNLRRLRAEGIMTADENSPANFKNAKIIGNIIIGCRRGITHYGAVRDSGLKNVLIADNIIAVPNDSGTGEHYIGIRIPHNNGNNANVIYRNNVVHGFHPSNYLLSIDELKGISFDHNIWYQPNNPNPFHIGYDGLGSKDVDFQTWFKKCNSEAKCDGDVYSDSKLADITKYSDFLSKYE